MFHASPHEDWSRSKWRERLGSEHDIRDFPQTPMILDDKWIGEETGALSCEDGDMRRSPSTASIPVSQDRRKSRSHAGTPRSSVRRFPAVARIGWLPLSHRQGRGDRDAGLGVDAACNGWWLSLPLAAGIPDRIPERRSGAAARRAGDWFMKLLAATEIGKGMIVDDPVRMVAAGTYCRGGRDRP
jgi:hypothetical protein